SGEILERIERAQQERLASAKRTPEGAVEALSPGVEAPGKTNGLASAVGGPLAQLLRRPEIVIEDLVEVVREKDPEFFAEIESSACAAPESSGADPSPRRVGDHRSEAAMAAASVRDGVSFKKDSHKPHAAKLSAAVRNEMKTVETEIKYAGYLD